MDKKINRVSATLVSVGILIGFGIFFKADDMYILNGVHPNLLLVSWIIVGAITIMGAYVIGQLVPLIKNSEGLASYLEFIGGKKLAYFASIFLIFMYVPIYLGMLSRMFALYFYDLLGLEHDNSVYFISIIVLTLVFIWNYLSTKLSVKISDLSTIFKILPLLAVFIIGLFFGDINQSIQADTSYMVDMPLLVIILAPLTAMMMTLDGWISISSLSHRIDNPEKSMPIVFVATLLIVLSVYILYFFGISLIFDVTHTNWLLIGDNYLAMIFENYFGQVGVSIVLTLVLISGLGCINGFYLSGIGYIESASAKGIIPMADKFKFDASINGANIFTSLLMYFLALLILGLYYLKDTTSFLNGVVIEDVSILFVSIFFFILFVGIIRYSIKHNYKRNKIVLPAIIAAIGQILIVLSFYVNTENSVIYVLIITFILYCSFKINQKFNSNFDL